MSLQQKFSLKHQAKLSPQLILEQKFLQFNAISIEQHVEKLIEENPALERDDKHENEETWEDNTENETNNDHSETDFSYNEEGEYEETHPTKDYNPNTGFIDSISTENSQSVFEKLAQQITQLQLSKLEIEVAEQLIGNLDKKGFLAISVDEIADYFLLYENKTISSELIEKIRLKIKELEPIGMASLNLTEFLLHQINKKKKSNQDKDILGIAQIIVEKYFTIFSNRNFSLLTQKINISELKLNLAIIEIEKLKPYPLFATEQILIEDAMLPDISIFSRHDNISVTINDKYLPPLRVKNDFYTWDKKALSQKQNKEVTEFVEQNIQQAHYIIEALKMRYQTLKKIAECIARRQKDYFETGDETTLKPLILKDIAEEVGRDISTISRALDGKYIETDWGIKPTKLFTNIAIKHQDKNTELTHHHIEQAISKLIDDEDKNSPLTDEQLKIKMDNLGYYLSRKSIHAYRTKLGLPIAKLRRKINS